MIRTNYQTTTMVVCDECNFEFALYDCHHDQIFCPRCGLVLYEEGRILVKEMK